MMDDISPNTASGATTKGPPPSLGDDPLCGAGAIAEFLFGDRSRRRKVYYLTGEAAVRMPYFRLGTIICTRKSRLLRWIESHEARGPSTGDA